MQPTDIVLLKSSRDWIEQLNGTPVTDGDGNVIGTLERARFVDGELRASIVLKLIADGADVGVVEFRGVPFVDKGDGRFSFNCLKSIEGTWINGKRYDLSRDLDVSVSHDP